MDFMYYVLLALILFLLYKIIETNCCLSRLNLEIKDVELQSNRERSRTLQEVRNATKLSEQILKELKSKEEERNTDESADTAVVQRQNESEKPTKVVYRSVGPHNNDNTYVNVNFNLNLLPPSADFGFQAFKSIGSNERLEAFPLKALKY
ncbi:unnamed protein product [Arctia plantaginis]|uniref:ATP synthase protein MI25 n=1 Tax=Arctia plantaginis TaxID=874455 RepID=A0A8S1BCX2_ARCPL|nr:unnamed protein product [Arctia plantaginis]